MPLYSKQHKPATSLTIEGFSETEILAVFQRGYNGENLTAQLLLLYYVLTYKDCCLSNMKSLGKFYSFVFRDINQLCYVFNRFIWLIF